MEYADIIAQIVAAINDDEVAAITGPVGNGILKDMTTALGVGYQFAGVLTPTSNPARTDAKLWALAWQKGKYYNLDGRVLDGTQVAVFTWNNAWTSALLPTTTGAKVRELFSQYMDAATADAEIDLKADALAPVVPPMVTGSARGILGRSAAARFLYRQTSSGSGAAWLRSIHGRTVSYNQLVRNGDFSDGTTGWYAGHYGGNNSVSVANNVATVTKTAVVSIVEISRGDFKIIAGHRYAIFYDAKVNQSCDIILVAPPNTVPSGAVNTWARYGTIYTAPANRTRIYFGAVTANNNDTVLELRNMVCVDLTQAGLDSIITTPEQFEAWQMEQFGHKGYLGYTPGTLVNVNPTGVLTTGRNVWDEELEEGLLNVDGTVTPASGRYCSKNHIPCGLASKYYFYLEGGNNFNIICYYDANFALVGYEQARKGERTIPSGAVWAKFGLYSTYTGGHICINISDPTFNGQYVPYNGHTLPLDFTEHFPNGLNGVNDVVDKVYSDENGKFTEGDVRFGKVDLGTLNWAYHAATQVFFVITRIAGMKAAAVSVCSKYPTKTTSPGGTNDGELSTQTYFGAGQPFVKDSSFGTDAVAFKAAMSGVPLVFELATPQHVTFTNPSDAVYPVTEGGTEQVLPVNGSEPTTIAPDFQMQAPLRRGYDTPTDATFDNFLEVLGQHLGKTIAKEWDAETQTYQFDIL